MLAVEMTTPRWPESSGSLCGHRRGGLAHHAVGAGEEDLHRPGEDVGRVRGAVPADHPAPGRRTAVDDDGRAQRAQLGRGGDRLVHRLVLGDVGGHEDHGVAEFGGQGLALVLGEVGHHHLRAGLHQAAAWSPRRSRRRRRSRVRTIRKDPQIPPWVTRSGGVPSGGGGSMPRLETAGFDSPKVLYCCDNSIDYCFASAIRAPQTRGHHPRRGARVRSSHRQRSAHGHRHRPQGHPCQHRRRDPRLGDRRGDGRADRGSNPTGSTTSCSRRVSTEAVTWRATPPS